MKVSLADYIIGDRIHGRYEVSNFLGEGGIAQVYECVDLSNGQHVAVKVFHPSPTTPDLIRMGTQKEAVTLASIRHPNIVSVFNIGHTQKGMFIVMELIKGRNLAELIKDRVVQEREFISIALQSVEGLAAVHRNGFLHLDIKPGNIMLLEEPDGIRVKLVDFGLAQLCGTESMKSPNGEILGSIFYISPERLLGEVPQFKSDYYSLGHTFYHLLAGKPAFHYTDAEAVADAHVNDDAPSLATWRPDLSEDVIQVIHWMLQRRLEDRPESTLDILQRFNEIYLRHAAADAAAREAALHPITPITEPPPKKKWTQRLMGWFNKPT